VSEHLPADEAGGDEGGFVNDDEEHPLEGGQGDDVEDAQEHAAQDPDSEREDNGADENAGVSPVTPAAFPNPTH
jgi:hypothetical protein